MCGIAGTWGPAPAGVAEAMTRALAHRGPDDVGYHTGGRVRLGMRRLSIIDPDDGAQPVYDETGTIAVVCNGEIYNHRRLRTELIAKGHRFRSRSDTEVIVHLYEEYGDDCVRHLDGMFAFALADGDRLLLARDRFGIKPLYYHLGDGLVVFASEIKALLRCPTVPAELDPTSVADARLLGNPLGDTTFLRDIRRLPPGHLMVVAANRPARTRCYYRLPTETDDTIGFGAAQDTLIDLLRQAVGSHLDADVPVGLMLSGGLDSTALALAARDIGRAPMTFAVAHEATHPDAIQAGRLADHLGWSHRLVVPEFDDYLAAVPDAVLTWERPGGLSGVPLLALYAETARHVKAGLLGEGADELFAGYQEYIQQDNHRPGLRTLRLELLRKAGLTPSAAALDISAALMSTVSPAAHRDRLLDWNMGDSLVQSHLEFQDKMGMASGVELRVPFLDRQLVEFVRTLPGEYLTSLRFGIRKHLLKRAVLRAWGGDGPVADSVLRVKRGAPSAGHRHLVRLARECERDLPDDYLSRSEIGACLPGKLDLLLHELFVELFVVHRGVRPDGFSLAEFVAARAGRAIPVG